ncbi:MAG TPA: DUF3025 domain-containing protein [Burkholderiales bacterium]|nr:DUF3025 domain-containing protein [Burkholderiales bacterium]
MSSGGAPAWNRAALVASPLLATVRPLLEHLSADRFPTLDELNLLAREQDLRSGGGAPIVFVPAAAARSRRLEAQYEIRIHCEGAVPTRAESWHDLFNALAWLVFPGTKATINRLHHDEMLRRRDDPQRGTARDVLTLFDEGGVIAACADASLARLLAEFRWKELFWTRRADVATSMRFRVFGHAIHEKALAPYKGVTAKTLVVEAPRATLELPDEALIAVLDERAAAHFAAPGALASTRSLHPLPILGVPGWTSANENAAFYDDPTVFRSGWRSGKKEAP